MKFVHGLKCLLIYSDVLIIHYVICKVTKISSKPKGWHPYRDFHTDLSDLITHEYYYLNAILLAKI